MRIAYTPGAGTSCARELRAYFASLMTPERPGRAGRRRRRLRRRRGLPARSSGSSARDGWLALSWPEEYGGRGATMLDQLIFTDEAAVAGVPVPFLTINTVGPTIMRYGTAEQKAFYLPQDRGGRAPLLDRLLRARGRHRPGVAAHPRRCATATST